MKRKRTELERKALRRAVGRALALLMPDLLCLAGAVCLTVGAARIYPPAGYLAAGALLLLGAARWRPWGGGADDL